MNRLLAVFHRFFITHTSHQQWQNDILHHIISRNQLVILKYEAYFLIADFGQFIFRQSVNRNLIQIIFPAIHHVHATNQIHKRCLT
jgi:hypothetical protein